MWIGSIVLLFVVYQLWGTNITEARTQNALESEFEDVLAEVTPTTAPAPTATTVPSPPPDDGSAVAHIVIPAIGVDKIVVEGVARSDLQKGPGHYPDTPMPGQEGNAAIAGHRTTYGAPFNRVDELVKGDEILVSTVQGTFRYEFDSFEIVSPSQVDVVDDKGDDRLTLTSCHPKFSARQRIVVTAFLSDAPAPTPVTIPREVPVEAPTSLDVHPRGPLTPVLAWGAVVGCVWLAFFALSRRWRRWPAYALGAPVFLVALFPFFAAVSELLPSNF